MRKLTDRLYTGRSGAWRSLVARGLWVAEVPGSNPGAPIFDSSRRGITDGHPQELVSCRVRGRLPALSASGRVLRIGVAFRAVEALFQKRLCRVGPTFSQGDQGKVSSFSESLQALVLIADLVAKTSLLLSSSPQFAHELPLSLARHANPQ